MQIIIHAFGGEVMESQNVMHGKISNVFFKKSNLFHDLGSAMICMRYHSLIANKSCSTIHLGIESFILLPANTSCG